MHLLPSHLIYKSFSPYSNLMVPVQCAPFTIGITVTFMFHSFFCSLARSWYLFFFSLSFNFILWSAETVKSIIIAISWQKQKELSNQLNFLLYFSVYDISTNLQENLKTSPLQHSRIVYKLDPRIGKKKKTKRILLIDFKIERKKNRFGYLLFNSCETFSL